MISHISIRNFRSLAKVDIHADWISSFVGANDAGKSNVLRALNLFFNGETDLNEPFDFARDYNQFAAIRKRKAPQIEISITFELPSGYIKNGQPDQVEWSKVWRRDGEVRSLERRTFGGQSEFPPRSKIPTLLDRVQFTYVPAIKDKAFFADLQGRLYDVLASVAEQPLKKSAGAFQEQLGSQLQELLDALRYSFGAEASMRLPENLREIFENLEISSDEIPLSRRGDGVKVRHIPMMLKFIAEKRNGLLTQGGVRYTHLWGFEEPENNVEMSAAFKMVDEFVDLIDTSDRYQLFVTTHSPIFYRLDEHRGEAKEWLTTHFVSKQGHETIIEIRSSDEVDETMGLMPIVAPYISQAKQRYDELKIQLDKVQEIAGQRKPTVFVEGESDRCVLSRAWELFSGIPVDKINICAGEDAYGSANALHSRSLAWLLTIRHRPVQERVKAGAIFDRDDSGNAARQALGNDIDRFKMGKLGFRSIPFDMPVRLQSLKKLGFIFPVDLETLYADEVWNRAEENGWLEPRDHLNRVLSEKLVNAMAKGGPNPFSRLEKTDALRLEKQFTDEGKRLASRSFAKLKDLDATDQLNDFQPIISSITSHLFPK